MRAITICPPYPSLILLPDDHPHKKRVENRTWSTSYRGPLLIHSGKSTKWLGSYDPAVEATLPKHLGMIVGVVDMVDCVKVSCHYSAVTGEFLSRIAKDRDWQRYPWLLDHQHASGPWCHIYANARQFAEPIPYRGAQGFFNVPDEVVAEALAKVESGWKPTYTGG